MKDGLDSASLADLNVAGVFPQPEEAVAIVLEVCEQVLASGPATGVPPPISATTVRIAADGTVGVAGGAAGEDDQTVSLLGRLLLELTCHRDKHESLPAPADPTLCGLALRAALAVPERLRSVSELAAALRRHAPADGPGSIAALWNRYLDRQAQATAVIRPFPFAHQRPAERPAREGGSTPARPTIAVTSGSVASYQLSGNPARAIRAALMAATMLLLAGAWTAIWFSDDHKPVPPPGPMTRPVGPRKGGQPAWEILNRPGTSPLRAVSAEPSLRPPSQAVSTVGRARVTPAHPADFVDPNQPSPAR